jgi:two-component system OmpR family response regulator
MKPKILVVDDERSMQDLLRDALSLSGFEVSIAANDLEFREIVFRQKPEVIILDILLGDKDGTQIYEELLREGLDESIPVVFLSALAHGQAPTFPQPGRRYSLIGKPFDCDELVDKLHKLIASRTAS